MARITFTSDDLLRAKLLPPGWYPVLVKSYEEQQAGTDGSTNHVFTLTVDGGQFSGVPIRLLGNEKGYFPEFVEFISITIPDIKQGVPFETEKLVGKKLDGFVQRSEYKGRPQNQFVSFRNRAGGESSSTAGR